MSGYVGDLNFSQQMALDKLREAVTDIIKPQHDDNYLLKWLRARKFDVSKAESMLRNHIRWRKKIGADTILVDYENPGVMNKYVPYGFLGFDKGGSPVRACYFGRMDMKGLALSITEVQAVKFITKMIEEDLEMMKKQNEKLGSRIDTHAYIFDMEGFSVKQLFFKPVYRLAGILLRCYEANYPEHMKCAYFVNAPPYFTVFYAMLKAVFPEETIKKFKVFSPAENWKEILLNDIDSDVLPPYFGGTRKEIDHDPDCPVVVNPAKLVPESFYLKNIYKNFVDEMNVKTITIQSRSAFPVEVNVPRLNCTLNWEFMAGNHDIGFGVYYKENKNEKDMEENKLIEVISVTRKDTTHTPIIGSYICKDKGTYIIKFDNSYSWLNRKEISYRIGVAPPPSDSINEKENLNDSINVKENFKMLI